MCCFGAYPWDIEKKSLIQSKVSEIFPNINWLYRLDGEMKKENFDACDAYVACLGFINKERYGDLNMVASNIKKNKNEVTFNLNYWNHNEKRKIYLND